MVKFSTIDDKAAPPKPVNAMRPKERMRLYESWVSQVRNGNVGRIEPDSNETARSISYRVARAAKRTGRDVRTWIVDDIVYFRPR